MGRRYIRQRSAEHHPPVSDRNLAQIIWQAAKLLVSQLEQHYGFGQKERKRYPDQVVVIKTLDLADSL
jgi:hypothetical protein